MLIDYDIKFYFVYIGHTIVSLRIVTVGAWLSAGRPEWVAAKTNWSWWFQYPIEQDLRNFMVSYKHKYLKSFKNKTYCFAAIGINFVGGAIIDFCRKRFATIERPSKGSVIEFFISQEFNWTTLNVLYEWNKIRWLIDPCNKFWLLRKFICGSLNSYGKTKYRISLRFSSGMK